MDYPSQESKFILMKKISFLICLLSILISCKQKKITSNFNKSSKKTHVKSLSLDNKILLVNNKITSNNYTRNSIKKTSNNLSDLKSHDDNQLDLYAELDVKVPTIILKENLTDEKLIKTDNILITKPKEKNDLLKLSQRAKKNSLLGLVFITASIPFLIGIINGNYFREISNLILYSTLSITGLIFSFIGRMFSSLSLKRIRKRKLKIKNQKSDFKKNILISLIVYLISIISYFLLLIYALLIFNGGIRII